MKIFFAWTQNCAVTYYRFISYAKYMRKMEGIEVAYSNYVTDDSKIINWQFELDNPVVLVQLEMLFKAADISVIGAINHPKAIALMQAIKHKYKKPILMEIDDYAINLPACNIASNSYKHGNIMEWILLKQMELSDGIIVSTKCLKELYSQYNKNINVIQNGVDLEVWENIEKKPKNTDKTRIGFTGSPNHTADIRLIKNVILKILEKYSNVEFYFQGCNPEFLQNKERIITDETWDTVDKYPQRLADANFDIALAPLRDNSFNRGKSNLRYLEMSMLKLPTIASKINDYKDTIIHNENGYLCETENEWIQCLSQLVEDENLRKRIGESAFKYVSENYDVKNKAVDYINVLKQEVQKWTEKILETK